MAPEPSAVIEAARAELAAGRLDAAHALLQPLAATQMMEAVYLRGVAYCMDGDYIAARPLLDAAATALPDAAQVQADWVQCLDRLDDLVTGVQVAGRACDRHPRFGPLHWLHGMLQLKSGDANAALAACRIAVALLPQGIDAWLWLARAQREAGQVASAAQSLQRVLALAPQRVDCQVERAEVLLQLGDEAGAQQVLEQALADRPEYAMAHIGMSELLLRREPDRALQHARLAAQELPEHPRALSVLSLTLRLAGQAEQAAGVAMTSALARFSPQSDPQPLPRELRDTSAAKLRHDIEQLRYLQAHGLFAEAEPLAMDLADALECLGGSGAIQPVPAALALRLKHRYNRLLVHRPPSALAAGAINPALDGAAIEAQYLQRAPGIVWVDDLLQPAALHALQQYCLDSTLWFDFNHAGGYLGALFENGFAAPLLLQVADGLRSLLPDVIGDLPLTQLWAFKYDSQLQGIDLHADVAAVNVNFWLTPDSANLDPARGGLELWDRAAPADWDFADYNSAGAAGQQRIRRFLTRSGAQPLRVPYRCNRAVIFNSDLFHRTDTIQFAPGYLNRRINITMLFGTRRGRVR